MLIALSSVKLVLDTYSDNMTRINLKLYSDYLDMGFTVLFTIEALVKTIAFGFVMD